MVEDEMVCVGMGDDVSLDEVVMHFLSLNMHAKTPEAPLRSQLPPPSNVTFISPNPPPVHTPLKHPSSLIATTHSFEPVLRTR